MSLKCLKCRTDIPVENASLPCPKCGSLDRFVAVQDNPIGYDMVKDKQNVRTSHHYDKMIQAGDRIGNDGKPARIRLEIDVINKRKNHSVKVQNEKGEWVENHRDDNVSL
jgi:hypothetical protein